MKNKVTTLQYLQMSSDLVSHALESLLHSEAFSRCPLTSKKFTSPKDILNVVGLDVVDGGGREGIIMAPLSVARTDRTEAEIQTIMDSSHLTIGAWGEQELRQFTLELLRTATSDLVAQGRTPFIISRLDLGLVPEGFAILVESDEEGGYIARPVLFPSRTEDPSFIFGKDVDEVIEINRAIKSGKGAAVASLGLGAMINAGSDE